VTPPNVHLASPGTSNREVGGASRLRRVISRVTCGTGCAHATRVRTCHTGFVRSANEVFRHATLLGAVALMHSGCAQDRAETTHPILDSFAELDTVGEGSPPLYVVDLAERLVASSPEWITGSSDGPPTSLFGHIVHVLPGAGDTLYVLDAMFHQVMAYSSGGDRLWEFGKPGAGPLEFRRPVALAPSTDGFMVAASGAIKTFRRSDDEWALTQTLHVGPSVPNPADICRLSERLVIRATPSAHPHTVYVTDLDGGPLASFDTGYPHGGMIARTDLSVGAIACVEGAAVVVLGYTYLPVVRAYTSDGQLAWAVRLPDFTPMRFIERREGERTRFRTQHNDGGTVILRLTTVPPSAILVQAARLGPRTRTKDGGAGLPVTAVESYLIDGRTGRGVKLGTTLPEIAAATPHALYAILQDSAKHYMQLGRFTY
jgi:hypothetical protein